ncbi:hypothetical protein H072_9706 [Dactylellina haptotyla CBS 200.50]|uniref:Uncharacterized protein n=1 Tax=Dactylellina haptotyla (strain CBS 200.50) TaxID=1284197 RepID=S8BC08_DACHA|nr:hypothetical protein H072_9706 [Dactylellina haptotyla CBS 200.50]
MAKTKTKASKKARRKESSGATLASVLTNIAKHEQSQQSANIDALIAQALSLLQAESNPQQALKVITSALTKNPTNLRALELAGEINIELEDIATAIRCFTTATELDPEGTDSGAEKFLWLAQICEEGGEVAIGWYERAVGVLRVKAAASSSDEEPREKLCSALCGMAELYMTDLCMQPDAEPRCETYITEALLVSPSSPEALSTLASFRISQLKPDDARAALTRSLEVWKDLGLGDERIPAYPFRMSFTRLLIECEMLEETMDVLEGLQQEDDQVVDLWYLGGWCLFLIGSKLKEQEKLKVPANGNTDDEVEDWRDTWAAAREWLWNCEKLYKAFGWDDEGIKEHASELLGNISAELGEAKPEDNKDNGDDEEGGDWEDSEGEDGDEEMKDS